MNFPRIQWAALTAIFCTGLLHAAEPALPNVADIKSFAVVPEKVALRGGDDAKQLLLTAELTDGRLQDLTGDVRYTVSDSTIVRVTDGASPVNLTISAAANDSGAIAQSYSAGASLTIAVQTAAAGCATSPADANVTVQYRMQ